MKHKKKKTWLESKAKSGVNATARDVEINLEWILLEKLASIRII